MWSGIIQAPEIEAAHAFRLKRLCQSDAALENFALLVEREVGVERSTLRAVFRFRCTRPINFEEWAGDIGHAQLVFFENAPRLRDFLGVEIQDVLVPHAAQLDPLHAEFECGHFASTAKVLANLVADHRNPEWRFHTVSFNFSWRYSLFAAAASLGLRALSGTASSSTIAQPRKLILPNASKTAGTSTNPCPNSTKR